MGLGRKGQLGQTIRIDNDIYQVIGILNPQKSTTKKTKTLNSRDLNKSIILPLYYKQGIVSQSLNEDESLSEVIIQLSTSDYMNTYALAIKRILKWRHHGMEDFQIIIPQELLNQAHQAQNIFNLVLGSIAAISMLVGGIGIMNIMLASISERTREIGIRRALGASKFHIAKHFLIETLILTTTGAILGVLGGIAFSFTIAKIADWDIIITGWSICLSITLAVVVGIASGLYPALRAASMDPIKALRQL